ncbi:MAG: transposase [Mycoplasmatales bacterium]
MAGVKGVPEVGKQQFFSNDMQICTVHVVRSLMNKIAVKDKEEVISKLKNLFINSS